MCWIVNYSEGNPTPFEGGRTANDFVTYVNKASGPPSMEVDCNGMKAETAMSKLALTYFGPLEGETYFLFDELAKSSRAQELRDTYANHKFDYFYTTDVDCASDFGTEAPGIALLRSFDESPLKVTGTDVISVSEFMTRKSTPMMMEFGEDAIEAVFYNMKDSIFMVTEDTGSDFFKNYEQASKQFRDDLLFIYSNMESEEGAQLGEFFGVKPEDLPILRIVSPKQEKRYNYFGDVKTSSV